MATTICYSDPLITAVRSGDVEQVRKLLQGGKYDVNCTCTGEWKRTPLYYACKEGHLGVVRVLVSEFRANPAIRDTTGHSVLMAAVREGHEDVVRV